LFANAQDSAALDEVSHVELNVESYSLSTLVWLTAFCLVDSRSTSRLEAEPAAKPKPVPGWEDIRECSEFTSIDSQQSLSLNPDGSASLVDTDEAGKTRASEGGWSLIQAEQRVYLINVPGMISRYTLVSPPDGGCVLPSGSIERANLRLSWFSVQVGPEDAPD